MVKICIILGTRSEIEVFTYHTRMRAAAFRLFYFAYWAALQL